MGFVGAKVNSTAQSGRSSAVDGKLSRSIWSLTTADQAFNGPVASDSQSARARATFFE